MLLSIPAQYLLAGTPPVGRCGPGVSTRQHFLSRDGRPPPLPFASAVAGSGSSLPLRPQCASSGLRRVGGLDFRAEEHPLRRLLPRRRDRLPSLRPGTPAPLVCARLWPLRLGRRDEDGDRHPSGGPSRRFLVEARTSFRAARRSPAGAMDGLSRRRRRSDGLGGRPHTSATAGAAFLLSPGSASSSPPGPLVLPRQAFLAGEAGFHLSAPGGRSARGLAHCSAAALAVLGAAYAARHRARGPLAAVLLYGGTLFPALGFVNAHPSSTPLSPTISSTWRPPWRRSGGRVHRRGPPATVGGALRRRWPASALSAPFLPHRLPERDLRRCEDFLGRRRSQEIPDAGWPTRTWGASCSAKDGSTRRSGSFARRSSSTRMTWTP